MINYTYPESIEESQNYLRMTLKNISNHKLPFNPVSYLLWYEYAMGRDEQLIKEVEAHVQKDNQLSSKTISDLVKNNLTDKQVLLAEKKAKEFQKILIGMTKHLSDSENEIDTQGNILESCAMELSQATSIDVISNITERIITETKSIADSSKILKNKLASTVSEIDTLNKEIEGIKQTAKTDMLTGLLNRRGFDQAMTYILEDIKKSKAPMSLLMLDIDYFKKINDTHGHLIGDNVLKLLGKLLNDHIKGKDIAARFGGEEFILVLPETAMDKAYTLAEKIRTSLQKMRWKLKNTGESLGQVTISIGIAMHKENESVEAVIKRADDALYHAKDTGRNQTITESDMQK